ncbi:MAG: acyl-CoA dehydrogenase family protein [Cyanobacteria bacterium]|nr:acyl-CoA dehydrogenase family protein [Cyanobacteriota bacterium]
MDVQRLMSKQAFQSQAPLTAKPLLTGPQFSGKADAKSLEEEANAMAVVAQSPGYFERLARGYNPTTWAAAAMKARLEEGTPQKMKGYTDLLKLALRTVPPRVGEKNWDKFTHKKAMDKESAALKAIASPSAGVVAALKQLGLSAEDFKTAVVDPHAIDDQRHIPAEVYQRMGKLGLFRLKVPKEYGGMGLSQGEYAEVVRAIGHVSGSLGAVISAHSTIGSAPLLDYGTEAQRNNYLKLQVEGQSLSAFALTEPEAGTDVNRVETTATLVKDPKDNKFYWELNGEKIYITNTVPAGLMYVFAKTDISQLGVSGLGAKHSVFIIDDKDLKFKISDTPEETKAKIADLKAKGMDIDLLDLHMIRGSNQAHIKFNKFRIPVEQVMGGAGKLTELPLGGLTLPLKLKAGNQPVQLKRLQAMVKDNPAAQAKLASLFEGKPELPMAQLAGRVEAWSKSAAASGNPEERQMIKLLQSYIERKSSVLLDRVLMAEAQKQAKESGRDVKAVMTELQGGIGRGKAPIYGSLTKGRAGFGPAYAEPTTILFYESLAHAARREMFKEYGGKQGNLEYIQRMLGEMAGRVAALNAVSDLTMAIIDQYGDDINNVAEAAAIKVLATKDNWDLTQMAAEIFGGSGLIRGHRNGIERALRDAWIGQIVEGVNPAMQQVVVAAAGMPMNRDLNDALSLFKGDFKRGFRGVKGLSKMMLDRLFRWEMGPLSTRDGVALQRLAGKLHTKMGMMATRHPQTLPFKQLKILRAGEIMIDLYTLTAIRLKLEMATDLPDEERNALSVYGDKLERDARQKLKQLNALGENRDDTDFLKIAGPHLRKAFEAAKVEGEEIRKLPAVAGK